MSESTTPAPASIRYTLEEWMAEGRRLFGPDQLQWRFVCPICGNVQSPNDFRQYKSRGATPASAYQECIGRYAGGFRAFGENAKGTPERPCDYAAFGLFKVGPVQVEGHSFPIFDFDRSAQAENRESRIESDGHGEGGDSEH